MLGTLHFARYVNGGCGARDFGSISGLVLNSFLRQELCPLLGSLHSSSHLVEVGHHVLVHEFVSLEIHGELVEFVDFFKRPDHLTADALLGLLEVVEQLDIELCAPIGLAHEVVGEHAVVKFLHTPDHVLCKDLEVSSLSKKYAHAHFVFVLCIHNTVFHFIDDSHANIRLLLLGALGLAGLTHLRHISNAQQRHQVNQN